MIRTVKRRRKVNKASKKDKHWSKTLWICLENTRTILLHVFLDLDRKCRYSIILSNNENERPGHTQLSRKSFKRIWEWKLEKTKRTKQNSQKYNKKLTIYKTEQFTETMIILNSDSQQDASFLDSNPSSFKLIYDVASPLWPKNLK